MFYGLLVGTLETFGLMQPRFAWLFVPFTMVVIWHYYVDGRIWRFSQDPELKAMLRPALASVEGSLGPLEGQGGKNS